MVKKKFVLGIIIVCILGIGFFFLFNQKNISIFISEIQKSFVKEQSYSVLISDNGEPEWNFNVIEDPNQEVDATIIQVDNNTLELTLFEHANSNTKNGYKWDMALCNVTGNELKYQNEDAGGGFENAIRLDANYGNLVDYGMNKSWCGEQGGKGFVLFSNGAKNLLPKKIRLSMGDIESFKLFAGTGSVIIDGSASTTATQISSNDALCRTSDGTLHAAWRDGGSDANYGNSTDGGATWTTQQIAAGTHTSVGVICDSTDKVSVYYISGGDVEIRDSSDNFATATDAINTGSTIARTSCAIDGDDIIHCCGTVNGMVYANSTAWNTEITITTSTDDTDGCDIEVDLNNEVYIIGVGTDGDDLDIFSSSDGFARHEIYDGVGWGGADGLAIAIGDDNQIYTSSEESSDLQFCNGTTSALSSWSCQEVDASNSHQNDISITEAGNLYIIYSSGDNNDDGITYFSNSTDNGITWQVRTLADGGTSSGYPSMAHSTFPSSNRIDDLINVIFTRLARTEYFNITTQPAPIPNLSIIFPITENVKEVSSFDNISIEFNVTKDDVLQDAGVKINNITIDGIEAPIKSSGVLQEITTTYSSATSGTDFVVPEGTDFIVVKVWGGGGSGGDADGGSGGDGAGGGYSISNISVNAGDNLTIRVGGGGLAGGGGDGGGGGGYSGVFNSSTTLIIAGGGGAGAGAIGGSEGSGGPGGGTLGEDGTSSGFGSGGTQSAGGSGGSSRGVTGSSLQGGNGGDGSSGDGNGGVGGTNGGGNGGNDDGGGGPGGGGGGGGYFGGGGGGSLGGGGGGGSAFIGIGSNNATSSGSGTTVANNSDSDYCGNNAGDGGIEGPSATPGNDGCVVLIYDGFVATDEFFYNGSLWIVNVTVPTNTDGLKDLFLNVSFESSVLTATETEAINYTSVVSDTCTCPGLNQNWEIDHSDACNILDDCDLGTGMLTFIGNGITQCNARIDTSDLGDPGSGGIFQIDANCQVYIS